MAEQPQRTDIGLVKPVTIDQEMRESYLSYAMSVIVARALPDVRDGLKPVQRRLLYAMYDMGLRPDSAYKKSARVVGEVLGKYHPHGDQSVYDAMVRMAQDFSMRYPLMDGQGNFGSLDGDAPAAMRYTEVRMAPMGFDLLEDIDKDTVDFVANFDDSLQEPAVLPATIPNLLVNGGQGIAVGMSTSIPPHNLGEVIDALVYLLDNWEQVDTVTVHDLMAFVKGPDFPTGGIVFRYRGEKESDALANAYATGRGRVTVQAKAHLEQMERNKSRIVITELPYQINKPNLLGRIADLHQNGRIEGLTDLRDESDRNGLRIVLETTRNVDAEAVLADLYKLTPLQSTFSIILLALVDGEPRILPLKQALRHFLDHRLEMVRRRSEYDLAKARERAHILEGLLAALDHLDAVIAAIRNSDSADVARENLSANFDLTDVQARAILDMQLRRLAALERQKIQDEYGEKQRQSERLELLLSRPDLMRRTAKEALMQVRERYADLRRTQIVAGTRRNGITAADLLPDERVWVLVGRRGTVARTPSAQMIDVPRKPAEPPAAFLPVRTQDVLYLIAADGQAVNLPVHHLPPARALGVGAHWAEVTALERNNHLATAVAVPVDATQGYLFLTTLGGLVKRVAVADLPGITGEAFTVMNVPDDDALGWARVTTGRDEVVLVTAMGQAIRFAETAVRPMGLRAGGVMGVKLANEADGVVTMDIVDPDGYLWSITDNGLAKATTMHEYPTQGRYGQGVVNVRLPEGAFEVVAAVVGRLDTLLVVTTAIGTTDSQLMGDATQGRRTIKPRPAVVVGPRNRVTGVLCLTARFSPMPEAETAVAQQLSLLAN